MSDVIVGRLSAGNFSGTVEARLPLRIEFEGKDIVEMTEQLVDGLERRLRRS